jgi:hypothetical protein
MFANEYSTHLALELIVWADSHPVRLEKVAQLAHHGCRHLVTEPHFLPFNPHGEDGPTWVGEEWVDCCLCRVSDRNLREVTERMPC